MPTSKRLATRPRKRDAPGGRLGDARQDFEQGRFAGTIAADDAEDLALLHLEADILQGPELLDRVALHDLAAVHDIGRLAHRVAQAALHHVAEIRMAVVERPLGAMADEVALRQILDGDDRCRHAIRVIPSDQVGKAENVLCCLLVGR